MLGLETDSTMTLVKHEVEVNNQSAVIERKKRVWQEIPCSIKSEANANSVASCKADGAGLKIVNYGRQEMGFRNWSRHSRNKRRNRRMPNDGAWQEPARPKTEVTEEEKEIRKRSLIANQVDTSFLVPQPQQINQQQQHQQQDLNSTEQDQSKTGESDAAQMSQAPNQEEIEKPPDNVQQPSFTNVIVWNSVGLGFEPTYAPVGYFPVIAQQLDGIGIINRNLPISMNQEDICLSNELRYESMRVPLSELAEKIKENPDKVRAPKWFKEDKAVRSAIAPCVLPTSTHDEVVNAPLDRIVYIGDEIYLCLERGTNMPFLWFSNRAAYIRHHVRYYFSKSNLLEDSYLRDLFDANEGVCPFEKLIEFNRLKMVKTQVDDLMAYACLIENVEFAVDSSSSPIGYRLTIPLPEREIKNAPKADDGVSSTEITDANFVGCPEDSCPTANSDNISSSNDPSNFPPGVSNVSQCPAENVVDTSNEEINYDFLRTHRPLPIIDPITGEQILPENVSI
ncbi:unnamed protein product [Rodentolepis nana]|uniref:HTH La-type RNA-binding domain-containing protein n=1 Tax=Rodentolepis nana TaxID=102285 RepID=A0A0R3TDM3_RODNA|nr:unnamed protein product [Rodentolepis nana]